MTDRYDDYDRSDSTTTLDSPSDGLGNYTIGAGTWGIASNAGRLVSSTSQAVAVLECSESAGEVEHTMSVLGGDTGLIARYIDNNNYLLMVHSASNLIIYHKTAGNFNVIVNSGGITGNNGDVFKFVVDSSNNVEGYQNGVLKASGSGAPHSTGTKWGIRSNNVTNARFNDWTFTGAGGGGVTGTLAYTNANDTLAGAGRQTNTGTLARTNANDTSAGSGTQTNTGTLARTNANDTLAGAGAQTNTGTLAYSNANDTLAAVGYLATTGTADVTNANDTLAATGSGGDLIDSFYDRPSKRKEKFNQKREERDERLQDILQMFEAKMESPKIAPIVVQPKKAAPAFDYERDDEETLMALL